MRPEFQDGFDPGEIHPEVTLVADDRTEPPDVGRGVPLDVALACRGHKAPRLVAEEEADGDGESSGDLVAGGDRLAHVRRLRLRDKPPARGGRAAAGGCARRTRGSAGGPRHPPSFGTRPPGRRKRPPPPSAP